MDEADHAQRLTEQHSAFAIARISAAARAPGGATHCVDCDAPIPQARRDAVPGAKRCVDCQEGAER